MSECLIRICSVSAVVYWLGCWTLSRKVAGLNPNDVVK